MQYFPVRVFDRGKSRSRERTTSCMIELRRCSLAGAAAHVVTVVARAAHVAAARVVGFPPDPDGALSLLRCQRPQSSRPHGQQLCEGKGLIQVGVCEASSREIKPLCQSTGLDRMAQPMPVTVRPVYRL